MRALWMFRWIPRYSCENAPGASICCGAAGAAHRGDGRWVLRLVWQSCHAASRWCRFHDRCTRQRVSHPITHQNLQLFCTRAKGLFMAPQSPLCLTPFCFSAYDVAGGAFLWSGNTLSPVPCARAVLGAWGSCGLSFRVPSFQACFKDTVSGAAGNARTIGIAVHAGNPCSAPATCVQIRACWGRSAFGWIMYEISCHHQRSLSGVGPTHGDAESVPGSVPRVLRHLRRPEQPQRPMCHQTTGPWGHGPRSSGGQAAPSGQELVSLQQRGGRGSFPLLLLKTCQIFSIEKTSCSAPPGPFWLDRNSNSSLT